MFTNEISLIVYDFDGVMTNNTVLVQEDGTETVIVNRGDGLGVGIIKSLGFKQLILSTEENPVVTARAKKLKLEVIQGSKDKKKSLLNFCKKNNIDTNKTLYVGNDTNDLEVMNVVGFRVAPKDAHYKILKIANKITKAKGGKGVIRELAEWIENDRNNKK